MAPPPPPPPVPIAVTGADQDAHLALLVEGAKADPPCSAGPSDLPLLDVIPAGPLIENGYVFRPEARARVGQPERLV